ncbi:hypothetical protein BKA93DRAFT_743141 [Sparassis latifolia]
MVSHKRSDIIVHPAASASSSRLASTPEVAEAQPRTFKRLRSTLEQSLRTATKSKGKFAASVDEVGEVAQNDGKGKERALEETIPKGKPRSRMLSKVSFRRPGGKDINSPLPPVAGQRKDGERVERDREKTNTRVVENTGFSPPSLRQASMSSPTLHLASQPFPSPYVQPFALPASSSSNVSALVSPPRERPRKPDVQFTVSPKDISGPIPLTPKHDIRSNGVLASPSSHIKTKPPPLVLSKSPAGRGSQSPGLPETPTRRPRDGTRSPDPSPPSPSPRGLSTTSKRAAASNSHLPLSSPPSSPTTPRPTSPLRARSSSRTPTHRAGPSASSSHVPLGSSSSSSRRPSIDRQRSSLDQQRPSAELRRPSFDQKRSSLDQPRQGTLTPSPPSRAASPASPVRLRAVSPTQRNYSPNYYQNRFFNVSTASLATITNSEYRELVRSASSLLCKEMLKPPSQLDKSSLSARESEEVEFRMRALARLERVWGRSASGMGSSTQLSSGGLSSGGISAGGEERERKLFCEAVRDGYVLCQFVNKLFPGTISRIDTREDGFVRTSNVTKFLAACSSVGLHSEELFNRDDLIEATAESLTRVARTILSLHKLTYCPPADKLKYIQGGSGEQAQRAKGPYGLASGSRGAASTPDLYLSRMQRSTSPTSLTSPQSPGGRKRWSPPQPLPTVRSDSPNEDKSAGSSDGRTVNNGDALHGQRDRDDVPPMSPPPRSPLRIRTSMERSSIADSTRASLGESLHSALTESYTSSAMRQSQASSTMTDSTMFSSLLDVRRTSSGGNKFGTIRTMTTEATSLDPGDAEDSVVAVSPTESLTFKRIAEVPPRPLRERRPSETTMIDLSRVIEETEESSTSAKGESKLDKTNDCKSAQAKERQQKVSAIKLGKGKWPDDFLDAFQSPPNNSALLDEEDLFGTPSHPPVAAPSPRKLAVVGAPRPESTVDPLPQFPRRPTHRARHSVDTAGLPPRDALLPRDSSPDTSSSPSPRLVLRRSSTKTGMHRNGVYIPRNDSGSRDSENRVPFPRSISAEQSTPPLGDPLDVHFPAAASGASTPDSVIHQNKPRQLRGRFQSEIDGASSRRKPRPNSYDELGAKPRRSRFESMVNLGVATGNASASDLMIRDSYDGSAVRQTLIVREDGKPSTQFQLGNCIGRGQFGAVYRALNLNTGQMVAVKRIRLEGLKEEEIAQLMREVDLVKSLSHPSIVKYEGMARDDDVLSIVLELAENGSLGQTLKAFGKLNERLVASYVVKILEGLHYLHQSDVVHCDLKAANILTTKNGNVKLSDFGVSLNLRAMEREMKDIAGTPNWMAPEVIELKGASTKSDIWSLGCTVIELLTGRPPYAEIANGMSVMFRIVEDAMPPLPEGSSESLQDFLKQCFNKEPTKRPSAELLCEHEWLKHNWAVPKDLRPQDSIPFLRRVSTEFQKSEAIRYLANIEMPDPDRSPTDQLSRLNERLSRSPTRRRLSNDIEPVSPREHSFVPTTFGKPVICRVCQQSVKKSAVLCEQCSLIAHVKCAGSAPPTCDLRTQLLLYAQYAEIGNAGNPYDPADLLEAIQTSYPASPGSENSATPRTSIDTPLSTSPPQGSPIHPPSAFKVLNAFKRSRSSLTVDQTRTSPAPSPVPRASTSNRTVTHKLSVLKRKTEGKERPISISSSSTSPNSSSLRSTGTAMETSSRRDTPPRSTLSIVEAETRSAADKAESRLSRMTSYSVVSATGTEREDRRSLAVSEDVRKGKKNGCVVQ